MIFGLFFWETFKGSVWKSTTEFLFMRRFQEAPFEMTRTVEGLRSFFPPKSIILHPILLKGFLSVWWMVNGCWFLQELFFFWKKIYLWKWSELLYIELLIIHSSPIPFYNCLYQVTSHELKNCGLSVLIKWQNFYLRHFANFEDKKCNFRGL